MEVDARTVTTGSRKHRLRTVSDDFVMRSIASEAGCDDPQARTNVCGANGGVSTLDPTTRDRDAADRWIGRVIGDRHRIARYVTTGGMGHLFIAEHVSLGGQVAVKLLLEGSDGMAVRYFHEEARLLSHLHHPNLVSVFDCAVTDNGDCYTIMEWLPGCDLGRVLQRQATLAPGRALWVLTQLAAALDYVHSRGVVHRDIKPENVIIFPRAYDLAKLFDFGVASRSAAMPDYEQNKLIGTPLYMAPEQAAAGPCTSAADRYGLAALGLELLTGHTPYPRRNVADLIDAVLTTPPMLPSAAGFLMPGLDELFAKALARDPAARFATCREFAVALREVMGNARFPSAPSPARATAVTRRDSAPP